MKKILLLICSALFLGSIAVQPAFAQTNTNAPTAATFLNAVQDYFTAFDTNSTTFTASNELSIGADYVSGLNTTASLTYHRKVYSGLSLGATMRNTGVAGTVAQVQAEIAWSASLYDTEFSIGAGGGYDLTLDAPYLPVFLEVKKALTAHTFAGVGLENDIFFSRRAELSDRSKVPTFFLRTGFTF